MKRQEAEATQVGQDVGGVRVRETWTCVKWIMGRHFDTVNWRAASSTNSPHFSRLCTAMPSSSTPFIPLTWLCFAVQLPFIYICYLLYPWYLTPTPLSSILTFQFPSTCFATSKSTYYYLLTYLLFLGNRIDLSRVRGADKIRLDVNLILHARWPDRHSPPLSFTCKLSIYARNNLALKK